MRNYIATRNTNENLWDALFSDFGLFDNQNDVMLRTDLSDEGNHYEMTIDVPNVNKNEIKLEMENGYLTVSIEKKVEKEDKKNYLFHERSYSSYSRTYYLSDKINKNDIQAKLENGVLTLLINKPVKNDNDKYIQID